MKFFGPARWGLAAIDFVPTPNGADCFFCEEKITAADRGVVVPASLEDALETEAIYHRGCFLAQIFGRTADFQGRSRREAGRIVEQRVDGGAL